MKINTHPTTTQHTNLLPVMLVVSESQFTFLMGVCFDPIIYFSMIYATIWYFLLVNSQLIFTTSLPIDQHGPLIPTHPPHIWSLPLGFTFSILYQYYVHQSFLDTNSIFPYMVLNIDITFETNLSILSNTITKSISLNCHARKTSTTLVRLLHVLQLRFLQVTQLSGFYFSKKELRWMFSSNMFFLLITSPRVLS